MSASAKEPEDILLSRSVETLENGDYVVTELYRSAVQPYTGTSGSKSATRYNAAGTAIFTVTVTGSFTYTYGSSSRATGASAGVTVHHSSASFVSKNASTSGSTATATGTVRYNGVNLTQSVSISCDKYGNLS